MSRTRCARRLNWSLPAPSGPLHGAMGVEILAVLTVLCMMLDASSARGQALADGQCVSCHRDLDAERLSAPALGFEEDVHGDAGFTCTACHGGDASVSEARLGHLGMLARPPRRRIPELCGRCHSRPDFMRRFNPDMRVDQVVRYRTSVHGQRLLNQGDTRVATCVDCHGTHGIRPASDPRSLVHPLSVPETCAACHGDAAYMAAYEVGTEQTEEYLESVHWAAVEDGDLSAPVCNDCHGNHGAVPPGYASVGRVCAECHVRIGEYFLASPHDTAFARMGLPGCATCHENHYIRAAGDELLAIAEPGTCGGQGCHTRDERGGAAALVMRSLIDSLRTAFDGAEEILREAEEAGMPVSQAQFELTQARTALVTARAATHAASTDTLEALVDEGLDVARAGYVRGVEAFEELDVRRDGLAVSAIVILVLIVGLVAKIRQLEGSRAGHDRLRGRQAGRQEERG